MTDPYDHDRPDIEGYVMPDSDEETYTDPSVGSYMVCNTKKLTFKDPKADSEFRYGTYDMEDTEGHEVNTHICPTCGRLNSCSNCMRLGEPCKCENESYVCDVGHEWYVLKNGDVVPKIGNKNS